MLPRALRLTQERDIVAVLRRGERSRAPGLELRVSPIQKSAGSAARPRFAYVISTKVSKRANVRNRLKRRLRGLTALHLPTLPPRDYVVVVTPAAVSLTRRAFADAFTRLLTARPR
jgi:ribonuclease P protein component